MCGRYGITAPAEELVEVFDVPPPTFDLRPRYNVAPGQECPVVGQDRKGRRIGPMSWGIRRSRSRRSGGSGVSARPLINARGETAATTPAFREAFRRRRCLVPADGFFEWKGSGHERRPFWIHPRDGKVLALAGLWEEGCFAVVTVVAGPDVLPIHHRMPALLGADDREAWLDLDTPPDTLAGLLRPASKGVLDCVPVSRRVNDVRNEGPEVRRPEVDYPTPPMP